MARHPDDECMTERREDRREQSAEVARRKARGLKAAPRTGPWREAQLDTRGQSWMVVNRDTQGPVLTSTGRPRTWTRRARAYAHAEQLNARDAARAAEARKELGL